MRCIDVEDLVQFAKEYRYGFHRDGQVARALDVISRHPDAVIIVCCDEGTGHRFGGRNRRRGMCEKIGSSTCKYQLWASWAPKDLADADEGKIPMGEFNWDGRIL